MRGDRWGTGGGTGEGEQVERWGHTASHTTPSPLMLFCN